jgi:ADP-heptose:LPS heptosyltransferase
MKAIRDAYPDSRLVVLSSPGRRDLPSAKDVLSEIAWLDEIIEYFPEDVGSLKGARALVRAINSKNCDVFFELSNDVLKLRTMLRNMLFARCTRVRWAGGWSINTLRIALQAQSEHIAFPNEVRRLLLDVRRYGMGLNRCEFTLPVNPGAEARASALLKEVGIDLRSPVIAIAPGAKRPASRWPGARFGEVGAALVGAGFQVLLLGSEQDRIINQEVASLIGDHVHDVSGRTDITLLGALISQCCLVICNDSGPQHLASALGIPCVAVTSFWHLRGKWRANHPRAEILQKFVPCHTCFSFECPNNNLCLTEITSTEVTAAAFRILQK